MFYHYHFDIFPSIYMQFKHNLESVINATLSIHLIIDNSSFNHTWKRLAGRTDS